MRAFGIDVMFTLNGGHIWPLYEACRNQGVRVFDTRHEQSATFAAEAYAKLTRRPVRGRADRRSRHHQRGLGGDVGVVQRGAARRARRTGPAAAVGRRVAAGARPRADPRLDHQVGGHRPRRREGRHRSSTRRSPWPPSRTAARCSSTSRSTCSAPPPATSRRSTRRPGGASSPIPTRSPGWPSWSPVPSARCSSSAATSTGPAPRSSSPRPSQHLRVPVFTNGLGRGTLPADHELAFLRTRGLLKSRADVVVVLGTPLDFRLGFGRFGGATVAHVVDAESQRAAHVDVLTVVGDIAATLRGLADSSPAPSRPRGVDRRAARRRGGGACRRSAAAGGVGRGDQADPGVRRAAQAAGARLGRHLRRG